MGAGAISHTQLLGNANLRLCRLRLWPNYVGFGFNLEQSPEPPHIIILVESNSPAAAGGLKIRDVILTINQDDVSKADYDSVQNKIKIAENNNDFIELLVIEQGYYQVLKEKSFTIDRSSAITIDTPSTMPNDYVNFPKHQPRACQIHSNNGNTSFGFEVINGDNDIGVYIQEVFPNTPASRTLLRKSDRIIEIDDKFVDKDGSKSILEKLENAKAKGAIELYVMDTDTYAYYICNKIPLESKKKRRTQSASCVSTNRYDSSVVANDTQLPSSNTSTIRSTFNENRPFSLRPRQQPNIRSSILPSVYEDELYNGYRSLRSIRTYDDKDINQSSLTFGNYKFNMSPSLDIAGDNEQNESNEVVDTKNDEYIDSSFKQLSYRKIRLCKGDLTTQQTDVIVVSSTSRYLFDTICEAGGDFLLASYLSAVDYDRNASVISIDAGGQLACKKVYFLSCDTDSEPDAFYKSVRQFVSDAIKQAIKEGYRSIAFPAIGCGQLKYSISDVARAMIKTAYRKLSTHNISVSFVIQL